MMVMWDTMEYTERENETWRGTVEAQRDKPTSPAEEIPNDNGFLVYDTSEKKMTCLNGLV